MSDSVWGDKDCCDSGALVGRVVSVHGRSIVVATNDGKKYTLNVPDGRCVPQLDEEIAFDCSQLIALTQECKGNQFFYEDGESVSSPANTKTPLRRKLYSYKYKHMISAGYHATHWETPDDATSLAGIDPDAVASDPTLRISVAIQSSWGDVNVLTFNIKTPNIVNADRRWGAECVAIGFDYTTNEWILKCVDTRTICRRCTSVDHEIEYNGSDSYIVRDKYGSNPRASQAPASYYYFSPISYRFATRGQSRRQISANQYLYESYYFAYRYSQYRYNLSYKGTTIPHEDCYDWPTLYSPHYLRHIFDTYFTGVRDGEYVKGYIADPAYAPFFIDMYADVYYRNGDSVVGLLHHQSQDSSSIESSTFPENVECKKSFISKLKDLFSHSEACGPQWMRMAIYSMSFMPSGSISESMPFNEIKFNATTLGGSNGLLHTNLYPEVMRFVASLYTGDTIVEGGYGSYGTWESLDYSNIEVRNSKCKKLLNIPSGTIRYPHSNAYIYPSCSAMRRKRRLPSPPVAIGDGADIVFQDGVFMYVDSEKTVAFYDVFGRAIPAVSFRRLSDAWSSPRGFPMLYYFFPIKKVMRTAIAVYQPIDDSILDGQIAYQQNRYNGHEVNPADVWNPRPFFVWDFTSGGGSWTVEPDDFFEATQTIGNSVAFYPSEIEVDNSGNVFSLPDAGVRRYNLAVGFAPYSSRNNSYIVPETEASDYKGDWSSIRNEDVNLIVVAMTGERLHIELLEVFGDLVASYGDMQGQAFEGQMTYRVYLLKDYIKFGALENVVPRGLPIVGFRFPRLIYSKYSELLREPIDASEPGSYERAYYTKLNFF